MPRNGSKISLLKTHAKTIKELFLSGKTLAHINKQLASHGVVVSRHTLRNFIYNDLKLKSPQPRLSKVSDLNKYKDFLFEAFDDHLPFALILEQLNERYGLKVNMLSLRRFYYNLHNLPKRGAPNSERLKAHSIKLGRKRVYLSLEELKERLDIIAALYKEYGNYLKVSQKLKEDGIRARAHDISQVLQEVGVSKKIVRSVSYYDVFRDNLDVLSHYINDLKMPIPDAHERFNREFETDISFPYFSRLVGEFSVRKSVSAFLMEHIDETEGYLLKGMSVREIVSLYKERDNIVISIPYLHNFMKKQGRISSSRKS